MAHDSSQAPDAVGRPQSDNSSATRPARHGDEVVLIIGGGDEFGESLAVDLALQGKDVAILFFRRPAERAQSIKARVVELGQRCLVLYAGQGGDDQAPERAARRIIRRIVRELGGLDAFVSLATPARAARRGQRVRREPLLSRLVPNAAVIRAAMQQILG